MVRVHTCSSKNSTNINHDSTSNSKHSGNSRNNSTAITKSLAMQ